MTTTATLPFAVTPRRDGEPEPDLIGFALVHRALRSGTSLLATVFTGLDQPSAVLDRSRRREIARFAGHVLHELHGHHVKEDDVLWPVIAACAGPHVDLEPLTDDHTELQGLIDTASGAVGELDADWRAAVAVLAPTFVALSADLDAHIADEEAAVFPVMRTYVSKDDFARCERMFQKGSSFGHLRFMLPWLMDQCSDAERAELLAGAPVPLKVILRTSERTWRRRRDVVRGEGSPWQQS